MIFGIGTDIVRVARMRENLETYGEKFARRILGETELTEFKQASRQPQFLAKRFAAKEATAKAMGTGFRDGLFLAQICVVHDALGRPGLTFSGRAQEFIDAHCIIASHLSLADEEEHAIAFVTLVQGPPG